MLIAPQSAWAGDYVQTSPDKEVTFTIAESVVNYGTGSTEKKPSNSQNLSRSWTWRSGDQNVPPTTGATVSHTINFSGTRLRTEIVRPPASASAWVLFATSMNGPGSYTWKYEIPTNSDFTFHELAVPTVTRTDSYSIAPYVSDVSTGAYIGVGIDIVATGYDAVSEANANSGSNTVSHTLTCIKR